MDLLSKAIDHMLLIIDKNSRYEGKDKQDAIQMVLEDIDMMTNCELLDLIGKLLAKEE